MYKFLICILGRGKQSEETSEEARHIQQLEQLLEQKDIDMVGVRSVLSTFSIVYCCVLVIISDIN